jgi:uncharacterized protein (TIGR03000 family)
MRYTLFLALGLLMTVPAESSASCFGRCWGSRCSGCCGCYGSSCGGCWGSRCSGGYWGHHFYGCSGCYGSYQYSNAYSGCYGTPWRGHVSSYSPTGYYQVGSNVYRPVIVQATRTTNYKTTEATASRTVKLDVVVADPAGVVLIEGAATASTGTQRSFESPILEADKPFYYTITYQSKDGTSRESRTIQVQAGDRVLVNFTEPAKLMTEADKPTAMPEQVAQHK